MIQERKTIWEIKARTRRATKEDESLMLCILNKAMTEVERKTEMRILFNTRQGDNLE